MAITNYNNSKGFSYGAGFFMLIGLAILGFVFSGAVGALILKLSTGESIQDAFKNPANANILRIVQVLSVIISMFIPTLIVASIMNRKPFRLLGFREEVNFRQVGLVVLIVIVSLFIAGAFGYLSKQIPLSPGIKEISDNLEKTYTAQVEIMLNLKTFGGYILSLLVIAFIPALCEEMLFRGGLQNFLTKATKIPWLSIILVSILFSLVHFSFYGFLPRLFLGMMLGLIFHLSGNIWLAVAAHFINNAIAVTSAYVMVQQGIKFDEAMNKDLPTFYWGFLTLPLFVLFLWALKKNSPVETDSNQIT